MNLRRVGRALAASLVALPQAAGLVTWSTPSLAQAPAPTVGAPSLPIGTTVAAPSADSGGARRTLVSFVLGGGSGHVASPSTGLSVPGDLAMLEVRWERTVHRAARLELRYGAALIPFVRVHGQRISENEAWSCPAASSGSAGSHGTCSRPRTPIRTVTGVGIVPVFFRVGLAPAPGFELFASARVGIIQFDGRAPLADRGPLAPLLGGGGGIVWRTEGPTIVAEYDVMQLSNGAMRIDSPGMIVPSVRLGIGWQTLAEPTAAREGTGRPTLGWNASVGMGSYSACGEDAFASLAMATVRRDGRIAGGDGAELRLGVEAMPLAISARSGGAYGPDGRLSIWTSDRECLRRWSREPGLGVGLSPFALRGIVRGGSRGRAYFDLTGGALLLSHDFPNPGSRGLNFILGAGLGLELRLGEGTALTLGYRLQHVSNGYTGRWNPGVNLHSALVGFARSR